MRLIKCAKQFVIAGVVAGICSISRAQSGGGGTEVWTKVVNVEEGVVFYDSQITVAGQEPFTSTDYWFPQVTHVWETLNEDTNLTAPWTTKYLTICDITNVGYKVTVTSNQYGVCVFSTNYKSTLTDRGGHAGVEKWRYNSTNKNQERKEEYKYAGQSAGGGN